MRRLVLVLLLLAVPLPAHAAGSALRWNSCRGESNRNFACAISTGSQVLIGSFEAPSAVELSGVEVYMRITTADGAIPAWWQMFNSGSCRATSLSAAFDVSTEAECDDPWQGQAGGAVALYRIEGSSGVDLRMAMAVPPAAVQTISGGRHYAAFRLMINHSRSSGAAACEGCAKPACIAIERMVLTSPAFQPDPSEPAVSRTVELTSGMSGMGGLANVVMWQGGTPTCAAGAAKTSTWGELKRRFK